MRTYMLSFTSNTGVVNRQSILDFLDTRREVLNWYAVMPSTILIVSRHDEAYLAKLLIDKFGNDITFIIHRIDPHSVNGFANKPVWDFINHHRSSGRWE